MTGIFRVKEELVKGTMNKTAAWKKYHIAAEYLFFMLAVLLHLKKRRKIYNGLFKNKFTNA